jgi:hypothetical protein
LRAGSVTGQSFGKLLDLRIASGSLAAGNASGVLMTHSLYNNSSSNVVNERTGLTACNFSLGGHGLCDRNFVMPPNWAANDILEAVSDLDLLAIDSGGEWYDPTNVTDKPLLEMMFRSCHNIDERSLAGYLAPGNYAAFWCQQHILPNVPAHAAVTGAIQFSWY